MKSGKSLPLIFGFLFMLLSPSVMAACPTTSTADKLVCEWGNVIDIVILACYMIATAFMLSGLFAINKHASMPQQYPASRIATHFIVAGFLMAISVPMDVVQNTLFTSSPLMINEYGSGIDSVGNVSIGSEGVQLVSPNTFKAIIGFVMLIGVIAFIRGIILVKEIGENAALSHQGKGAGKAITHIIGGALAWNIVQTTCFIADFINMPAICIASG